MEKQRTVIVKTIFKKKIKAGAIAVPNFKTQDKVTGLKMMWHPEVSWQKVGHRSAEQSPETDPTAWTLNSDKRANVIQ